MPAGFSPVSVTFVSAKIGWVLGTVPAGTTTALAIAHTTDGGVTWSRSPAPTVTLGTASAVRIRFANTADGWIMAPPSGSTSHFPTTLWWTHDGGAVWHQGAVPGGGHVAALAASHGLVRIVTINPTTSGVHLYATPDRRVAWTRSHISLRHGAGPVPSADLVLHGRAGWVVVNNRTVITGARLTSGNWQHWTPPCADAKGSGHVAASSTSALVAVCNEGVWGPPPSGFTAKSWLFTSHDGGNHFADAGQVASSTIGDRASSVATPPSEPQVAVVGGPGLAATFDGGRTWRAVYTAPSGSAVRVVGFTTATQGVAIVTNATTSSTPSTLLMTSDGGTSWSPVSFGRATS